MTPAIGRRPLALAGVGLLGLVLAAYGAGLGRYFTSEDFLLIRYLAAHPPWRDPDLWTGPWLGITVVKFYRPVSTLLYGLEIRAFGANPVGYNVLHTLVHALNAVMLFAIVRRLALGPRAAFAAAALFALYPLHPNAVLFGASFATIYGAACVFACVLTYQRFRDNGGRGWLLAALGCFALGLGSYEAAAILPGLLGAYDVLVARRRPWPVAPFVAVLGAYFVLRRMMFGRFVGGYDDLGARLTGLQWRLWLPDLATSIQKLHAPTFARAPTLGESLLFAGLATVVPLAVLLLIRPRAGDGDGAVRVWLFGWAWVVLGLIPFAFRPCVPGNGRFWYVSAAGVALAAVVLVRAVGRAAPGPWRLVPALALAAGGLYWTWLLAANLGVYIEAGRTARRIQGEIIREYPAAGAPPRIFVARYPFFLLNAARVPLAQVYHYGLRDAVNAPFARASVPVFPLLPVPGAQRLAIFAADPRATILEWDAAARRLQRVTATSAPGGATEIAVQAPADGAVLEPGELEVEFVPGGFGPWRAVVVAPGNATITGPVAVGARDGVARLTLPTAFVTAMARLYDGGEFFWWLEAGDPSGEPLAFSRMRSFRLATRPERRVR